LSLATDQHTVDRSCNTQVVPVDAASAASPQH